MIAPPAPKDAIKTEPVVIVNSFVMFSTPIAEADTKFLPVCLINKNLQLEGVTIDPEFPVK